ncbi:hypothetical protein DERP_010794 [Dermatophagoides pteronyssinus]|uniref:Uncharacterized protein n=2 Tax=Dermatophagoides pteronyssinus TaxID=6956 RepID=A0ABQ8J7B4_DERPT|nr:uncharacterized protein LOC113790887 [Dermatophagoides pteronyssinus]KAH9418240.1 hypothetical protein DERP_010794 [Dermatophagoides pteronyssinus]
MKLISILLIGTLFTVAIAANIPEPKNGISKDELIHHVENLIHESQNQLSKHKHTEQNHKTVEEIYECIDHLEVIHRRLERGLNETTLKIEENMVNNYDRRLHELFKKL